LVGRTLCKGAIRMRGWRAHDYTPIDVANPVDDCCRIRIAASRVFYKPSSSTVC
jgi:hypothetical protein